MKDFDLSSVVRPRFLLYANIFQPQGLRWVR